MNKKKSFKSIKKIFFIGLFFLGFKIHADTRLVPHEVFVGDHAELSFFIDKNFLSLEKNSNKEIIIQGTQIENVPEYSLELIRLLPQEHGTRVFIEFIPWKTGSLEISSFNVGGHTIQVPPIRISSIIEKLGKKDLESIRTPLLLPGTTWILYGSIVFIVLCVTLLIFVIHRIVLYISSDISTGKANRMSKKRINYVKKQIRKLEKKQIQLDDIQWYTDLMNIIRNYISQFCTFKNGLFNTYTSTELVNELLICDFEHAKEKAKKLKGLCVNADTIRFSKKKQTENKDQRKIKVCDFLDFVYDLEKNALGVVRTKKD